MTEKLREPADQQERQAWETLPCCDEHGSEIRQISPKTKSSVILVTRGNWPGKTSLKAKRIKQTLNNLKIGSDRSW